MGSLAGEALIIFILISFNGFFALAEIAIVSSRKSRLRQLAHRGHTRAKAAVTLAETPETFLSSVQVGITLVGILSGAFGGATIAGKLADQFAQLPWLAPYAESAGLALVVLFILFLSVVLGELVPKQLALSHPERYALLVAIPMQAISRVAAPVVRLFGGSSRIVLRSLGVTPTRDAAITDEEITFMVDEGVLHGDFDRIEQAIVARALRLDDRGVASLMTPRVDLVWLDEQATNAAVVETLRRAPHTLYPVCHDSVDQIIGIVTAHDLYTRMLDGQPALAPEIIRPAFVIPVNIPALHAITLLKDSGEHLAVVVNEYGETDGILTAADVLASLVGAAASPEEPALVTRADGSWSVDGAMSIEDARGLFREEVFPEDERELYHTLAGFMLQRLGRIPGIGDAVSWAGYRFEVVDMDGHRVDRVLIHRE
ncbi:MAG TPA: hemolysin family protein [Armatimonadota bacterium]|nr:hemolysin family protein [Armatimonadota bacterium]